MEPIDKLVLTYGVMLFDGENGVIDTEKLKRLCDKITGDDKVSLSDIYHKYNTEIDELTQHEAAMFGMLITFVMQRLLA